MRGRKEGKREGERKERGREGGGRKRVGWLEGRERGGWWIGGRGEEGERIHHHIHFSQTNLVAGIILAHFSIWPIQVKYNYKIYKKIKFIKFVIPRARFAFPSLSDLVILYGPL